MPMSAKQMPERPMDGIVDRQHGGTSEAMMAEVMSCEVVMW